jgi:hypothetical protein
MSFIAYCRSLWVWHASRISSTVRAGSSCSHVGDSKRVVAELRGLPVPGRALFSMMPSALRKFRFRTTSSAGLRQSS